VRIGSTLLHVSLLGLGSVLAGFALAACFESYLDPGVALSMTNSSFFCH